MKMMIRRFSRAPMLALFFGVLILQAWPCAVPVFRYALERWDAGFYELIVLHRGELDAGRSEIVEGLREASIEESAASNIIVRVADIDGEEMDAAIELWETEGKPDEPWMLLRYPREAMLDATIWSGPLTAENALRIVDSPARREIAKRILEGDTAVWAFVECGDKKQDSEAMAVLEERLGWAGENMALPLGAEQDLFDIMATPGEVAIPLRIGFSTVSLSRDDPEEAILVAMLTNSEPDLHEYAEQPMVFPIFGRGRALFALVGKGINADNIDEASYFLSGPCSCQAKELNPGTDLLISADWYGGLGGSVIPTIELPPLVGLATLAEAAAPASAPAADVEAVMLASAEPASVPAEAGEGEHETIGDEGVETAVSASTGSLGRNMIIALAAFAGVVVLLTMTMGKGAAAAGPE